MTRSIQLFFLATITACMTGCIDSFEKETKYDRPDWLAGKVYTQITEQPELSTFARCLELTGYDTIINTSGSYSVFAPNNEAFSMFLQEHPRYGSVEGIPPGELQRIVEYHIVQNPWSKIQLRSLDIYGWIDTLDIENDEPRGFKRETLLNEKNLKVGVQSVEDQASFTKRIVIVDTLESDWHRMVINDSRKYVPFFFNEYFDIYELTTDDYEFYFGRQLDNPDDIYFAGGKIIGDEIFAENGFVYQIDRVVKPLQNAYQLLNNQDGNHSYNVFFDLVNQFPRFFYNEDETFDQPGAEQGFLVDSLFDLDYPELAFDINRERTEPPPGTYGLPSNVTIRYHHGIIAPTDQAFNAFINEYLVGPGRWGSLNDAPDHIRRMIANTHMSLYPIYPTNFTTGIVNGENDKIFLDEDIVVQKEFSSNCTFIGVDQAVVPRAFTSVAAPVYLLRNYSKVMYAIERIGLLPALNKENHDYQFYVESNQNTSIDSSLMYDRVSGQFSNFLSSGSVIRKNILGSNDLRILLLNHIGTRSPVGIARKEFIRNLAGNFIIIERDDESGEVIASGTAPTSEGYRGSPKPPDIPVRIYDADNGTTWDIDDWFSFTATTLFIKIKDNYPAFHELLRKAGLSQDNLYQYSFISPNEYYTVVIPTSQALSDAGADTLNTEDLKDFLMLHFIQGGFIFTDGNMPPGYYETARIDEKSTEFSTYFTEIYIETGIDIIHIRDRQDNIYVAIEESAETNILVGRSQGQGSSVYADVVNTAVIHEIDRALLLEEIDIR